MGFGYWYKLCIILISLGFLAVSLLLLLLHPVGCSCPHRFSLIGLIGSQMLAKTTGLLREVSQVCLSVSV